MGRQLFIPACGGVGFPDLLCRIHPSDCYYETAAGIRNCTSDGGLYNVGTNGRYWSSSPYSATDPWGGYLNFNSSAVDPRNNNNRANGLSVRCVQNF